MGISSDFPYPSYVVFVAVFVAAAVVLAAMPFWIRLLRFRKIGQQIRADGPRSASRPTPSSSARGSSSSCSRSSR